MIEKLDIKNGGVEDLLNCIKKINELINIINAIQKEREAERLEIQEWIGILEAVRESVNKHEKQIDELQMKLEPHKCEPAENTTNSKMENVAEDSQSAKIAQGFKNLQDPYAEQRKWIGKLCFFWGDNKEDTCYGILGDIIEHSDTPFEAKDYALWYEHCEPVKPTDSIIYRGGDNE